MTSPTPLKIAHIDTGLGLRGGQRQLLMLAGGLKSRGHDQLIVCQEGSRLEEDATQYGLRTFTLPRFDPWHAFGTTLLRQQLETWRPQIIHAHDGRGQSISWFASFGLPIRRIASRRVTFFPSDQWTYRLKYKFSCDAVVAVSQAIHELSVQAGVPAERMHIIPDGIEIPLSTPRDSDRARLRASWGFDNSHFVVGLLGASTPEKGHDLAFDAITILKDKLPAARLVLATEHDPSTHAGENQGREAGDNRILRLHSLKHLAEFFPGIDVFLMPSRSEGLGSSALWAMAYGVPVIAAKIGGLPEIVTDNETGWLIPPNSSESLAAAIAYSAGHRAVLSDYARNGLKQAARFSADIMVASTEALYYRLVSDGQNQWPS